MANTAFEFLRQFKTVESETETLVLKSVRNKISNTDLLTVFENGISGKYGKVYSADPQTLIGWVDAYQKTKNNSKNYLSSGLLPVDHPSYEVVDWDKEANKCYIAFLNGVSETYFNPAVYDKMMIDGKIQIDSYQKFYKGPKDATPDNELLWKETMNEVCKAKQIVLRNTFLDYKTKGFQTVYFIK